MAPIRRLADVMIDTTKFNVHELRQFIIDRFQNPGRQSAADFRGELRISLRHSGATPTWFSTCAFCPIRISCRACGRSAEKIREWRVTSARFRRRVNSCGASKACWPI